MASVFDFANRPAVEITDKEENEEYREDHPVIVNIVDALFTSAKVTIAATSLIAMNKQTNGAVMSAINMIASVANKMFVTSASSVPVAINTISITANDIIVSSINECVSQLYQTGAAFVTVFSGMLKYALNYGPEFIGAVGASLAVNALNIFRSLKEKDKKKYLRQYLATVLNGIVNVHNNSIKTGEDFAEGIECANQLNNMQTLEAKIGELTSQELTEMVKHVIPYMRSAEYNLSSEDLSFMAGNPNPFDGSNLEFRMARNVQDAINRLENNRGHLIELKEDEGDDNSERDFYPRKKQKTEHIDNQLKHFDIMLYLLNELNCTSSSQICRNQSLQLGYVPQNNSQLTRRKSFNFGGKKSKRTKKRKPVIRRKQTRRMQRKQTKRVQKKLRKKQTKK
jgi:hypothetical protein